MAKKKKSDKKTVNIILITQLLGLITALINLIIAVSKAGK
jgi:hypothetical protein